MALKDRTDSLLRPHVISPLQSNRDQNYLKKVSFHPFEEDILADLLNIVWAKMLTLKGDCLTSQKAEATEDRQH